MRVESAEAAERARQQAALEQSRMQQEMDLRRAEVAKKRPTWMLVVTGLALQGCGLFSQVQIVLLKGASLENNPQFVQFVFHEVGDEVGKSFGPFKLDEIPPESFTEFPPGTTFFVDVRGCATEDAASCVDDAALTAQGCSAFDTLDRDELVSVKVTMFAVGDPALACPPPEPEAP